jgi:hypothetical protein
MGKEVKLFPAWRNRLVQRGTEVVSRLSGWVLKLAARKAVTTEEESKYV